MRSLGTICVAMVAPVLPRSRYYVSLHARDGFYLCMDHKLGVFIVGFTLRMI